MSIHNEIAVEATKSAPPIAVTSAIIAGMSLSDWVTILTLVYLVVQIYFAVQKNRREERESRRKGKKRDDSE